jgi:hypothetical protein
MRTKIKLIFILNFIFFNTDGMSQTKTIDSLKKVFIKNYDSIAANKYFENSKLEIQREDDEFENTITFYTNLLKPISLTKVIRGSKVNYYLSLSTNGSTLNYGIKGVYVLFTDKSKWNKLNEKVDVKYDDGYIYSSFIELLPNDLKLFQTKTISKFKLYIYDEIIEIEDAEKFMLQSNYLQLMKK